MNLEAFKKLRDHLAAQPDDKWDMQEACGTAYCLAGHAQAALRGTEPGRVCWYDSAFLLGLDEAEADHVFCGDWSEKGWCELTRADALAYLDAAIEQGDPLVVIFAETE